jgi:hypothetical protein
MGLLHSLQDTNWNVIIPTSLWQGMSPPNGITSQGSMSDRTKNNTRQLHESFVIKWMCKYECRTHKERSFVIKINTTLKLNVS